MIHPTICPPDIAYNPGETGLVGEETDNGSDRPMVMIDGAKNASAITLVADYNNFKSMNLVETPVAFIN